MCRYYDDSNIFAAALRRLYKAAEMGRLDVLKWLWEREPSWRKFVLRTVYKPDCMGRRKCWIGSTRSRARISRVKSTI